MNRKPFDLERAKAGDPVVTASGNEYKFGAYNPDAEPSDRVIGWVKSGGRWFAAQHHDSGQVASGSEANDLFMVPKKRTVWVRLYRSYSETGAMAVVSATAPDSIHVVWLGPAFQKEIEE